MAYVTLMGGQSTSLVIMQHLWILGARRLKIGDVLPSLG
jgi:hypothetical protein